jgi:hypothetical protein
MSLKSRRLQNLRHHLRCNSTILFVSFESPISNNSRFWIDFIEHATIFLPTKFFLYIPVWQMSRLNYELWVPRDIRRRINCTFAYVVTELLLEVFMLSLRRVRCTPRKQKQSVQY